MRRQTVTIDEAVEVLEEVCPCSSLDCPDSVHHGLVLEARAVLRDADADNEAERRRDDAYYAEPPRGWEP